ncbi:hypothetical protein H0A36_10295 [Endozoicomonas sp. SM1973]|uniref:Virulence factor YopE GAP domain-containing protein n=1 Tax=Spartinivicinus marinus TaxID=2994442 RepID=A0A853I944_9GAMM|nr:hypothetical protein [Spartinivicinus marinus]MCX4027427.1 hypothetical protein [Spartinivicinus marinus]NYZ66401.1 hypothetical protein [Spartinivicinus marinus]
MSILSVNRGSVSETHDDGRLAVQQVQQSPEGSLSGRTVKLDQAGDASKNFFERLMQPLQQAKRGLASFFSQAKAVLSEKMTTLFSQAHPHSSISIGSPVLQAKNDSPEILKQKAEYAKEREKEITFTVKEFGKAVGQLSFDSHDALASGNGAFRKMTTALTALTDSDNARIKDLAKEILAMSVTSVAFQQWGDKGALLKAAVIETKQLPEALSDEQKQDIIAKVQSDLQKVAAKAELLDKVIQEEQELDNLRNQLDQEMVKLDEEIEALDQELKIQALESQYESAVIEDSFTGKKINLDQATGFYGRSVTDDKSKTLLDATSYLSSTVKSKNKLMLSPEQQQALANKFFENQLSFYDIKGQVKTTADLQWLRTLAVSSPIQLLGNELLGNKLSSKQSNLGVIATTLKHFINNTDKLWAEKNKENPEDQFDAVKRNQFIASELEQQVSQLPQATISAAFQKTTGNDSAQWRGVFDFATGKLSLSDELMETEAGQVLISLPTKLTTTLEKLAEVTAQRLGKEAPIALPESRYIGGLSSLTKAELSALEGIGIKKRYLET